MPPDDEIDELRVVGGGHAVRAEHTELERDHARQIDDRLTRQQTDLHMPAQGRQRADGRSDRVLTAQGVDGHGHPIRAISLGGHLGAELVGTQTASVDGATGTEAASGVESGGADVDGDDLGTQGVGDHDRRLSHTAAAEHGDCLTGAQPRAHMQSVEGRGEPASESDHGSGGQVLGHGHEVRIGLVDDDLIGPRTEMGEARLSLIGADLRVAGPAPAAASAAADEGHGHPLTDAELLDPGPRRGDSADELMPGNMRQADRPVVTGPGVVVAAAHARGLDVDDDSGLGSGRGRDVPQLGADGELFEDDGAHTADRRSRGRSLPSTSTL